MIPIKSQKRTTLGKIFPKGKVFFFKDDDDCPYLTSDSEGDFSDSDTDQDYNLKRTTHLVVEEKKIEVSVYTSHYIIFKTLL